MNFLPRSFYDSGDVVLIAKALLGKGLFTYFDGSLTGGVIVETEAYAGVGDRASHAFGGRRTERNEAMYGPPGQAYVYLCYGMHHLLNAVTAEEGTPHAVLIRAIWPTHGIETMLKRRGKNKQDKTVASGPGSLSASLGITRKHNGVALDSWPLAIADLGTSEAPFEATPRIGVEYAKEDAKLLYRFRLLEP